MKHAWRPRAVRLAFACHGASHPTFTRSDRALGDDAKATYGEFDNKEDAPDRGAAAEAKDQADFKEDVCGPTPSDVPERPPGAPEYDVKVILLGDSAVGKSKLIERQVISSMRMLWVFINGRPSPQCICPSLLSPRLLLHL